MTDKEYIEWIERHQIIDSEKEHYYRSRRVYTQVELLEIFPEAVEFIPKKISEWRVLRDKCLEMIDKNRDLLTTSPDDDLSLFLLKGIAKNELFSKVDLVEKHLERLLSLFDITNGRQRKTTFLKNEIRLKNARRFPILHACQRAGVCLVKNGSRHKTLCLFHNDHNPSMYLFDDSNSFHCFSCGAHGDVIKFVMKLFNFSFLEALNYLN